MPAAPIALGDIIQVTYLSTYQAQRIMLVNHWRVNDLADPGEYLVDIQSIANFFGTTGAGGPLDAYLPLLATDVTVDVSRAQRIHPTRDAFVDQAVNEPGTGAATAGTGNVAAVVTRKTDGAGRSQISNTHIGPIPSSSYAAGLITAPMAALLDAWGTEWTTEQVLGGPSGIELMPVVYHRGVAVPKSNDLRSHVVNGKSRTMRRRTVGLGI